LFGLQEHLKQNMQVRAAYLLTSLIGKVDDLGVRCCTGVNM